MFRIKRWRYALMSAVGAILIALVVAPSAQAYWDYQYYGGQSTYGQFWSSATGYEEGGSVYVILGEGYNYTATEYTETFDGNTGYEISYSNGGTNQTVNQWIGETYAFQECGWDSYPYIAANPWTYCHDWADW
jgi:hypothetical protein